MTTLAPVPVDPAPALPSSSDAESTFDAMFELFMAWMKNTQQPGMNLLASTTYTNALSAASDSALALQARLAAESASAISSGASHYKGNWASLTGALAMPASVSYEGRTWLLLENLADVTAYPPGVMSTKWRAYDIVLPMVMVTNPAGVSNYPIIVNQHYVINDIQQINLIPPANPGDGAMLVITILSRYDHTMAPNTKTIEYQNDTVNFDEIKTYVLRFMTNTWKFVS